jgi:hypothetical protein
LANDWESARRPNFAEAKAVNLAEALVDAVAPVKIKVGGWGREEEADWMRSGSKAWEKIKPAFLRGCQGQVEGDGQRGVEYTWDSQ